MEKVVEQLKPTTPTHDKYMAWAGEGKSSIVSVRPQGLTVLAFDFTTSQAWEL
jgi:hypothetical protein